MNLLKPFKTAIFSLLILCLLVSCSNELETETFENSSLITVKLQGTPSQLNRANIEVLDVQLRVLEDETAPNAWVSLNAINTGIHDLTDITNNQVVTLVDFEEVPISFVYNIKLVLGDQNSAVKNNIEYVLDMAPECEYASINIVEKQLSANKLYEFIIEFDVDRSVQFSSEGTANLNPKMSTLLRRFELY